MNEVEEIDEKELKEIQPSYIHDNAKKVAELLLGRKVETKRKKPEFVVIRIDELSPADVKLLSRAIAEWSEEKGLDEGYVVVNVIKPTLDDLEVAYEIINKYKEQLKDIVKEMMTQRYSGFNRPKSFDDMFYNIMSEVISNFMTNFMSQYQNQYQMQNQNVQIVDDKEAKEIIKKIRKRKKS